MDQIFYSPTNGNSIPSESKLATYLSRPNVTTPTYGLSISKLSLESPAKAAQVTPQSPEFIPSSSPNWCTPTLGSNPIKGRALIRGESPQSTNGSPKVTPQPSPPPNLPVIHQENVGGTTYFYPTANNHTSSQTSSAGSDNPYVYNSQANNSSYTHPGYNVYPGPASHVMDMQPRTQLSSAFFMPEEMRNEIQIKNEIANVMAASNENQDLPLEVNNYHTLYSLEPTPLHPKLPLPSSTFKATHISTGVKYCLRRLHGIRLHSTKCSTVIDTWKKLQHSNVVQLREIFSTKAFGDQSLVLVYDYHPGSETLFHKYFTPKSDTNGYTDPFPGDARPFSHKSSIQRSTANGPLLPETEIWSIIMQLTAGLRAIHQAGLACRVLDPTKIILTGKRIRFSFLGISDIVSFDPNQANPIAVMAHCQQEDLTALGRLVLALACRCLQLFHRDNNVQTNIELVTRNYSSDLRNLIIYLLTTTSLRTVADLMPMIGARFYSQLEALQSQCDKQEDELSKEMENGRLYRLLVKMGSINDRPEYSGDISWSETGDRYMLKLFRDYLFHSVTEDGRPWLDHAHIVQSLNKLDAGTMEKVQLMSRDEETVFVVTYAELKHCLEQAFSELVTNLN